MNQSHVPVSSGLESREVLSPPNNSNDQQLATSPNNNNNTPPTPKHVCPTCDHAFTTSHLHAHTGERNPKLQNTFLRLAQQGLCARFHPSNPLASTTITRSYVICLLPSPELLSPRRHTSPTPPQPVLIVASILVLVLAHQPCLILVGIQTTRFINNAVFNGQTPPPPRLSVHAANPEPTPPRKLSRRLYNVKTNPKPATPKRCRGEFHRLVRRSSQRHSQTRENSIDYLTIRWRFGC
ncbi:hypothetical protein BDN72DRAFT_906837 [Pluteus cervinus]|uniref:Uncharacterized protein n=1 Tax=Pluteus cervinus TaxID=181527 RepID=A0ACD2ZYY3_9AGAR|nr:hypothetical protein BDN72DRAFT_906837 [Pluteus cervinus]